jgi:hypothetical protein
MTLQLFAELLPIILSSAGATGSLFAAITVYAIKKAKKDAELKRKERLQLEILRLEGDEKLSALIFALIRTIGGNGSEQELNDTIHAYTEHLNKSSTLKNQIITTHISN